MSPMQHKKHPKKNVSVNKGPSDSISNLIFCNQNQSHNPNYQQFFNRTSNKFRCP